MDFAQGWDSTATLVNGQWVDRRPRRPEVAEQLRRETRLMPWLAARLPLRVPIPEVINESPLVVRHEFVPGKAITQPHEQHGLALATFLLALHSSPVEDAIRRGMRPRQDSVHRFRAEVLPLVPVDLRETAIALLDLIPRLPCDTVVHGDLGPEHVLVDGDTLSGVIDFGDAHIGDASIDLAWALFGTPTSFANALATTYGVTEIQRQHAFAWHQLGPWHEVTYGFDIDDPETVHSGLEGVVSRLAAG